MNFKVISLCQAFLNVLAGLVAIGKKKIVIAHLGMIPLCRIICSYTEKCTASWRGLQSFAVVFEILKGTTFLSLTRLYIRELIQKSVAFILILLFSTSVTPFCH